MDHRGLPSQGIQKDMRGEIRTKVRERRKRDALGSGQGFGGIGATELIAQDRSDTVRPLHDNVLRSPE